VHHPLSADRPLHDVRSDALGHAVFAGHLARCIGELTPEDGIVMGISGAAGSGRSTVLNFIRHHLREQGDGRYSVIDWNPWLAPGQEPLERRLVQLLAAAVLPEGEQDESDGTAALQARVVSALAAGQRRLVVIVDDACRLADAETRELLRLIACFAGAPNLVFVLALDRDSEAADTLSKVVHVAISLPLPDRTSLQQLFVDRIDPLMAEERAQGRVDEEYWSDMCLNGIDHFLARPRDAVRLVNAVSATLPAVRGEVNPVDFVSVETLRLFSPIAYDAIRRRPDAFLLPPEARRAETGALGVTREFHDRWREHVPFDDRAATDYLLMRLFPRLPDVLGARQLKGDSEDSWRPRLRIASADVFPVYVQLAIPRGAISNADLQSRLEHIGDSNQFAATLLELARDSQPDSPARLRAFLERLENHVGQNASGDEIASALRAVYQAADDLLRREDTRGTESGIDAQTQVRRLVRRLASSVEQADRVQLLEHAFGLDASLASIVDTVVMLGQEHGKYGGEWQEGASTAVTLSQLAQLENLALAYVRDAAEDGSLLRAPRMPDIMHCWATWNRSECRTWVSQVTATDDGLFAFLEPFMREAGSPSASVRGMVVANRLDQRRLRPFLEPGSIAARVGELAERPEREEQHRQLMRRYVLDHELLQQATSAEYSEGGSGAAEDSENVDPPPSGGGGGVLRDRFAA
jgi:predicted KAP-like P-loop ATPase